MGVFFAQSEMGKYDTYKGSTPEAPQFHHTQSLGNMILIQDRHLS